MLVFYFPLISSVVQKEQPLCLCSFHRDFSIEPCPKSFSKLVLFPCSLVEGEEVVYLKNKERIRKGNNFFNY